MRVCAPLVLSLAVLVACAAEDDLTVTAKQGKLKGSLLKTRNGRDVFAFKGIPYAKPPVGELRFKLAEPGDSWKGVRDATKEGPACIQNDLLFDGGKLKGVEDCLYLNVFTPEVAPSAPRAVLVWIHGGGWFSGSSSSVFYGPEYLLDKDIVLVTFNYRLGPLGFLSTGDSTCPGNNGLKDQTLALKWVRDNIAHFGGDPGRVTIAGQSAGGASTHYHMISPMSRGLFNRSISQSGTILGFWAIAPKQEGKARATKLATLLNCPTDTSANIVECLRTKDALDIVEQDPKFREWGLDPIITFRPVVEGEGDQAFIPEEPLDLLNSPSGVADIPWMTGFTSGDGGLSAAPLIANDRQLKELNDDFYRYAPLTLQYRDKSPAPHYVTERIREFYFQNKPITAEKLMALIAMYTDAFFFHPADSSVRLMSKANSAPVFYYYFDYHPPTSYTVLFGDPDRDYGAAHCDELQFLFPQEKLFSSSTKKFSKDDYKMVDILTTLWANFVKDGHPTPAGGSLPSWDEVSKPEVEYLHIGPEVGSHMSASLLPDRSAFWAALPASARPYSIRDEL